MFGASRGLQNPWNRRYLKKHQVLLENTMFCIFHVFAISCHHDLHPLMFSVCLHATHIPLSSSKWLPLLDIAHSAWCPCCSNEWPHGSVKYKAKSLWKLAMMCLKHCSFSSGHESEMMWEPLLTLTSKLANLKVRLSNLNHETLH